VQVVLGSRRAMRAHRFVTSVWDAQCRATEQASLCCLRCEFLAALTGMAQSATCAQRTSA
jgi:hypothetical protein